MKINSYFCSCDNFTFPIDKISVKLTFIIDNYAEVKFHLYTFIR